ncbi:MAG: mechanosensitive ion channel family protein, partial [Halobacteria archaeon]|nr:mechanosensitive ion channel family protein [Halobacteria archaeon]
GIVARTVAWLVYLSGFLVALQYLSIGVLEQNILTRITSYAPNVVAAVFILIFGAVLSDKAGILVSEKLEGIKVTDVSIFPTLVKYSILFVAVLMALNQL